MQVVARERSVNESNPENSTSNMLGMRRRNMTTSMTYVDVGGGMRENINSHNIVDVDVGIAVG